MSEKMRRFLFWLCFDKNENIFDDIYPVEG